MIISVQNVSVLFLLQWYRKRRKANLTTINSLIDELFGDIKTSFSNTELISLAAKVFNYSLGETIGFPFEKNTTTLGNKGSVVVSM